MRAALLCLLAAGCRNALGIPGDFTGEGFAVHATVDGIPYASAEVKLTIGNFTQTVTEDGMATFGPLSDGSTFDVSTELCIDLEGEHQIDGADLEITVHCDGLVAIRDYRFEQPFTLADGKLGYSAITGTTARFAPRVGDGARIDKVVDDTVPLGLPGPFELMVIEGKQLQITVHHDLFGDKVHRLVFEKDQPKQFGYGKAPERVVNGRFGTAVAADGNYILVGQPKANGPGVAHLYLLNGIGAWQHVKTLTRPGGNGSEDRFGAAVAIAGDHFVIGAPGAGQAFRGQISIEQLVQVGPTDPAGELGAAVAVAADGAYAVGAPAANAIHTSGGIPVHTASPGARYGASVAIFDGKFYVGAPFEDMGQLADVGAVYTMDGVAHHADPAVPGSQYGAALAANATFLFVGAPLESTHGAVRVLRRDTLGLENSLMGQGDFDGFGAALAVRDDLLAIGAPNEDSGTRQTDSDPNEAALDAGAVYLYDIGIASYLKASNAEETDHFGGSLAFGSSFLVVGAPFEDSLGVDWNHEEGGGTLDSGAVYFFR